MIIAEIGGRTDNENPRRARAFWIAAMCAVLFFAVLPGRVSAEMGVVSPCLLQNNAGGIIFVANQGPSPYAQPLTLEISVNSMRPQKLEALTSSSGIDVTMSGLAANASSIGGCGSISINPVPPGTYQVRLYVVRDGQAPVLVRQKSVDLGALLALHYMHLPPALALPPPPHDEFASSQSVGEVPFQHSVSLDGAAQVSIPIFTPPGRQGVEPSLALTYSSRGGNGPLGVGWSLSGLSLITSCRKSPALDGAYGGTYPDGLCLDGARLVEVSRTTGPPWPATAIAEYRTETDSYRKVIGHWLSYGSGGPSWPYPDWLEVYTPDGTILKYAGRAGSNASMAGLTRECSWGQPNTVTHTFIDKHGACQNVESQRRAWMLDTVEDRFGNRMEIDYDATEQLLPVEIRYTYHPSTWNYTKAIRFSYESRPDIRQASMDGLDYTSAKRLKMIDVVAPLGLSEWPSGKGVLHRYELTYEVNPVTAQSTLTQLKMCAGDQPDATCLSPLAFAYSGSGLEYSDQELPISPVSGWSNASGFNGFRTADLNGDGFDDVLYRTQNPPQWSYRLSHGVSLGAEQSTGVICTLDDSGLAGLGPSFVNFDRNETVDAFLPTGWVGQDARPDYAIGKADPSGTFQVSGVPDTTLGIYGYVGDPRVVALADFNGDMLPDLALRQACREVSPRDGGASYYACRWGLALNQSTSLGIGFANAMDFRWSGDPSCTEPSVGAGYANCAESRLGDPAFVLDVDLNGENEMIVPVRRGPTEEFVRPPDNSPELKALSFPIGTSSALRGTGLSSRQMPRLFLDVNGDGLPDAAQVEGGLLWIAMNVGGTFDAPQYAPVSWAAAAALSLPNELRVGDFNDDGLEDIYLVSARILLQANGQLGFVEKTLPIPAGDDSCQTSGCPGFASRKWDQLLDFNGDGLIDLIQMRGGSGHLLKRVGTKPGLLEKITGGPLLPEVRFTYTPSPESHAPADCTYPQYCLRKGMWLVSEVGVQAVVAQTIPQGLFNRTLYSYSGGRFDVRGRGWLGFAQRVATDEQTGAKTTMTMHNDWPQAQLSNFAIYRYPGAFRPAREVVVVDDRTDRTGSGKIHQWTTDYDYQDRFDGPLATSALVETRQTTEEAPAQGQTVGPFAAVTSRRSTFDVNSFGLLTHETSEAFEGGFTSTNTVPAAAKVTRLEITHTPSPPDQLNWLVRRYDRVAATSSEPARDAVPASVTEPARPAVPAQTITRVTDLAWEPGTTSIKRITVAPDHAADPSLYRVTELERDPRGNVNTIKITADSGTGTTTRRIGILWDTLDQTLMRRRDNPLQHPETFVYYAGLGALFSSEDANGLKTTIRRDRFGRPRKIQPASSAGSEISYELAPGPRLLVTSTRASGEVGRRYQDRWGQVVRVEQSRLRGNAAIVIRTFDRLGRLSAETLPYYENDPTVESTVFSYDNLGRLVETSIGRKAPAYTTRDVSRDVETWAFDGLVTEHTNAGMVGSKTTLDGAGRVVRSATIEPQAGREVVTRLEYGPFDVLDAVTDSAGHQTVNGYDILGRRVSMSDPSLGGSITSYNGYGEIVSFADADGVRSTTIERDLLGRPELERYTVGPSFIPIGGGVSGQTTTLQSSYLWDTAAHGKGLLAEATSMDDVKTVFSYDALGHLAKQEWRVPGPTSYAIETIWDTLGRPEVLKYPAVGARQLALRFLHEPQGTLDKVTDDATGRALWTMRKQDATGLVLNEQFGDATTTDWYLDSRKRLKMIETTGIVPGAGGATTAPVVLQRLAYDYGPGSLIKSRHNVSPDKALRTTEDFAYDFLGRLELWTTYQNCRASPQKYGYDDLGNLTNVTVFRRLPGRNALGRNAALRYGPSATSPNTGPMAVRELTEGGATVEFQYDSAGRQVSGGGRTITWNQFDLPSRIQYAATDLTFLYDAAKNRTVKQSAPSDTTLYAGGLYEHYHTTTGDTHVFNLVGPTGVFGQMSWKTTGAGATVDETFYFHPDMLGTPDVASSDGAGGGTIRNEGYEPFGQRRDVSALSSPNPVNLPSAGSVGFTGHEADDEVGLINMRGRIYDPGTMRFLTPDPLVQSPLFSQSLNRYSYVNNNPINFTDPTGFQCVSADACIGKSPGGGGGSGGGGAVSLGNPFELLSRLFGTDNANTGGGGTITQQPPTKEDATRRGADTGPGWATSDTYWKNDPVAGTVRAQIPQMGGGFDYPVWEKSTFPNPRPRIERINPDRPDRYIPPQLDHPFVRALFEIAAFASAADELAEEHPVITTALNAGLIFVVGKVPAKPLTYGEGFNIGFKNAEAGHELVLGKYPGNVQYVARTPGTVTLDVAPQQWTPMYNAGYVRGYLEAGGNIRFNSQQFTGTFEIEAKQILGIPGAPP